MGLLSNPHIRSKKRRPNEKGERRAKNVFLQNEKKKQKVCTSEKESKMGKEKRLLGA